MSTRARAHLANVAARNFSFLTALFAFGCQGEGANPYSTEEFASAASYADAPTYYVYRGQVFSESSSAPSPELDRLFDGGRTFARLTRSSEPQTTYLFDSDEESDAQQKEWGRAGALRDAANVTGADRSGASEGAASASSALISGYTAPTFLLCNGLMLTDGCREMLTNDLLNEDTQRFELQDLRDWLYSPPQNGSMNDTISSLGGHSHDPDTQTQHSFKVVVWEDPQFRGNSWTIVVDAGRPDFFDGNIHDNRMTRRLKWGDNISSVYAEFLP